LKALYVAGLVATVFLTSTPWCDAVEGSGTSISWHCEPWPECLEFSRALWSLTGSVLLVHEADTHQAQGAALLEAKDLASAVLGCSDLGLRVPVRVVEYLCPAAPWVDEDWSTTGEKGPNPYDIHSALNRAIRESDGQVVQTAIGDSAGAKLALLGKIGPQLNVRLADGTMLLWEDEEERIREIESEWPEASLAVLLVDPRFQRYEFTMRRSLSVPTEFPHDALLPSDPGDIIGLLIEKYLPIPLVKDFLGEAANVLVDYVTPTTTAAGIDRGDVEEIRRELEIATVSEGEATGYVAVL